MWKGKRDITIQASFCMSEIRHIVMTLSTKEIITFDRQEQLMMHTYWARSSQTFHFHLQAVEQDFDAPDLKCYFVCHRQCNIKTLTGSNHTAGDALLLPLLSRSFPSKEQWGVVIWQGHASSNSSQANSLMFGQEDTFILWVVYLIP